MASSHGVRCASHRTVAAALAALDDHRLAALVAGAARINSTIGGAAVKLDIAGVPVFAKRVPLTELERAHPMATSNLFELPAFYQYRLGSAGFGVWREVATHAMTTAWVLDDRCASFPLAYHWRVLESEPHGPGPDERARQVAFWDGSPAVSARLEAMACARASVVLFLEYVPHTVHDWLTAQLALGDAAVEAACALVEREARGVVAAMAANELVHFDTHFHNILTDGERLYFADFGLACSRRFDLAPAELAFLDRHASYDRAVTATAVVNWVRAAYAGRAVPAFASAILERHGPVAAIMADFYDRLRRGTKTLPFPVDAIRAACGP